MNESIALSVDGTRFAGFSSYTCTHALNAAGGSFSLTAADPDFAVPLGAAVTLDVAGRTVLAGTALARTTTFDKSGVSRIISGGDAVALMQGFSLASFGTVTASGLLDLAGAIARPVPGLSRSSFSFMDGQCRKKDAPVKIETAPGDTVFSVLSAAAVSRGLIFFADAGGGLVFGRRRSAGEPTKRITVTRSGGTVMQGSVSVDLFARASSVTVVGQRTTTDGTDNVSATVVDDSMPLERPLVVIDDETADAAAKAQIIMDQKRADGISLDFTVAGHTGNGVPWEINELVDVNDEISGVAGVFVVESRTFRLDKRSGLTTRIVLAPVGGRQ